MKLKIKTFEEFVPDLCEDYTGVPYVVEDDRALQPAVALQQALANYGPAKVFSGYTSAEYSDKIPVTEYRPDLQTFTEQMKQALSEQSESALIEGNVVKETPVVGTELPDNSASQSVSPQSPVDAG